MIRSGIMSIKVRNFWFRYTNSEWILRNLNFEIGENQIILLVGPTGSGKSTLIYSLSGLIPYYIHGEWLGEISIAGIPVLKKGLRALTGKVGLVMQNFEDQLLSMRVREEIMLGPLNIGYRAEEASLLAADLIDKLKLKGHENTHVSTLSFGQKQKVVLASILAIKPDIVLLDEPFSQLDNESKESLRVILTELRKEGKTIIVAEHDISNIIGIADELIVLNKGEMIYKGTPNAAGDLLRSLGLRITNEIHLEIPKPKDVVLVTKDLFCGWFNREILRWVNMYLREEEIVSIVGKNGSGKTTLGLTLVGILKPLSGEIEKKGRVTMVFQNQDNNIIFSTVFDEVFRPALNALKNKSRALELAEDLLSTFKLEHYTDYSPFKLSRGERLRLEVASAIASCPKILILDEPTFGQDYNSLSSLLDTVSNYANSLKFGTIILTHNEEFARSVSNRIYCIKSGYLLEY